MAAQAITAPWRLHAELLIATLCTSAVVLQFRKENINKKQRFIVLGQCYRIRWVLCHHCMSCGLVAMVELNYSQSYAVLELETGSLCSSDSFNKAGSVL